MSRWYPHEWSSTARATARPEKHWLYWAAAFIDGEGSMQTSSRSRSMQVSASQKDPELLYRLLALFGGKIDRRKAEGQHVWRAQGRRALAVVLTLYPILSARRQERIREMVKVYV